MHHAKGWPSAFRNSPKLGYPMNIQHNDAVSIAVSNADKGTMGAYLYSQLFPNLPCQGLLKIFFGLYFPTREFPQPALMHALRAAGNKYLASRVFDNRDSDPYLLAQVR